MHELAYRNKVTVQLKNAVMYHIVKNREQRRVPQLKDLIQQVIAKQKREMAASRKKQNNFNIEQMGPSNTYLTEDQAEQVHEIVEKINKSLEEQSNYITNLQKKFKLILKPKDIQKVNQHVALNQAAMAEVQVTNLAPTENKPQPFKKVVDSIASQSKYIHGSSANHEEFKDV